MEWYRCFIRGENFPMARDGETRLMGFYTTRWVEAETAGDAEMVALALLRADRDLAKLKPEAPSQETKVFFEEIEPCDPRPGPGGGFAWFEMEK